MLRRQKFDKRARNKVTASFTRGKAIKSNIAMHPFVIVSLAAALAVVIWVIMSFMLRYM